MELQLKQESFTYYEALPQAPWTFETTQEAIVPDYCADVARIVDVSGCALVHSREVLADGRLELSGAIKVSVLFLAEGEREIRALQLTLPLHSYCDGKGLGARPLVSARLKHVDARLLNPRKLLIRAESSVEVTGFAEKTLTYCTGLEEDPDLETLYDSADTRVVTTVVEREFGYVDELTLSAARSPIREILAARTQLSEGECRVLGSKLVIKGIVRSELLYKDESGALCPMQQEFLFSQVLPHDGADESCALRCSFDLTGYEYEIGSESGGDEGRCVTMKLHIRSMIQVVETRHLTFLSDLYSTSCDLKLERQNLLLTEGGPLGTKKQSLRELITTADAVRDVIWAGAECTGWHCQRGESGSFVEGQVRLRCLYLDEREAVCAGEKEITLKAETEMGNRDCPVITVGTAGEIVPTPTAEGVELRFTLEFFMEQGRAMSKTTISRAEREETISTETMPSLVLRKFQRGMRLWDIAKTYRTTAAAILAANDLDSESAVPEDQLLLIPRHK